MANSFQNNERLKNKHEFDNVFKFRKRISGKYCILYIKPEPDQKLGVVVSKKVSKKAVDRNRIKRWFREIYRINKDELPQKVHLILLAKPEVTKGSFNEVCNDIIRTFKKITY